MAKRQKAAPFDGLGPRERKSIDSAIRQVWYRSKARATAIKRCTDKAGFTVCEKCKKRTPKIKVDHIEACGPVDSPGYVTRLFCSSSGLQCWCHDCHKPKTKVEAAVRAKIKRGLKLLLDDTHGFPPDLGVSYQEHLKTIGHGVVSSDTPKRKRKFTDEF